VSVCATKTRVDIKRHLIDGTFPGTHSRTWQKQRWKSVDEKLVTPPLKGSCPTDQTEMLKRRFFQICVCEKFTTT